jgi:hypothetical protein
LLCQIVPITSLNRHPRITHRLRLMLSSGR